MNNKFLISIIVIGLLGGAVSVLALLNYTQFNPPADTPEIPEQTEERPITEQGVITCIPKIGTGPQTMECALGLQNAEGVYYGLRYLSDHDENFTLVSPEITVLITGTLVDEEMFGPDGNRYDTIGTIEIATITEL